MRALAVLVLACAASGAALAQPREGDALKVTWQAPEALRALYEKYLPPPERPAAGERAAAVGAWARNVRRRAPEIAASEGYFSSTVDLRFDEGRTHATVAVEPGPRTTVEEVTIEFAGDLALPGPRREARRKALREAWTLKAGEPFRSADWEAAKIAIQESLTDEDYPAGTIASSEARVDAAAAKARLTVVLASGPPFTLGALSVEGLHHYPESVIRRVMNLEPHERYSRARLASLQRRIQSGPWFSSVVVDVDHDPAHAEAAPVKVVVVERARRDVGIAVGYGTDDGARVETAYRDRNLLDRGFDLQSSIRAAQYDQLGYADVYLPPGLLRTAGGAEIPYADSVGVLAEHSTIQNLASSRLAVAGYRHFRLDSREFRVGLSYQVERDYPQGAEPRVTRALAPIVSFTWRHLDNLYDPRRGGVLNLQLAAGSEKLASGEDFLKVYGQYQRWIPLGERDQLLLRAELGHTFTPSRLGLPEDFLFRAGGAHSNRGYAYESLGVREGDAVVGGRYVATATAEYVHWLNAAWGAAVFTDVGDADDSVKALDLNPSFGAGARLRTPAGPLALDLAYAERERRFRVSFSVTVAF
ncbi:MAG TPA: BamA/TamA family outer membrane protein [Usitatibacter sp.]|nr:BamA/TamA family outer membrane protein [Usitatibacter sp.]